MSGRPSHPGSREPGHRPRGFHLARILGVPVTVDYSWFLVVALFLWLLGGVYFPEAFGGEPAVFRWAAALIATLGFFASVLAHELSHSLVARSLGLEVRGITLFVFGGVSRLGTDPEEPWTEIKVAAAGPLLSFFLAAFFYTLLLLADGVAGISPLALPVLQSLSGGNLLLGVFNLLPGYPLDGGRVLRALVWLGTGSLLRATRVASRVGVAVAMGLIALGAVQVLLARNLGGLWLVLIGLFLRAAAVAAGRDAELRGQLEGLRTADVMLRNPESVPAGATVEVVADLFRSRGIRAFPVQEAGEIRGLVGWEDLSAVPPPERDQRRVGEVMRPLESLPRVGPDEPARRAVEVLSQSGQPALLVYEGGTPVGMITRDSIATILRARSALERPAAPS